MPRFSINFTEYNDGHEYSCHHTFDAQNLKDANKKAHEYLMDYYGENGVDDITEMEEYWYHGNTICVKKIYLGRADSIKDNFTEEELVKLFTFMRFALNDSEIFGSIGDASLDASLNDYLVSIIEKLQKFINVEYNG